MNNIEVSTSTCFNQYYEHIWLPLNLERGTSFILIQAF